MHFKYGFVQHALYLLSFKYNPTKHIVKERVMERKVGDKDSEGGRGPCQGSCLPYSQLLNCDILFFFFLILTSCLKLAH